MNILPIVFIHSFSTMNFITYITTQCISITETKDVLYLVMIALAFIGVVIALSHIIKDKDCYLHINIYIIYSCLTPV